MSDMFEYQSEKMFRVGLKLYKDTKCSDIFFVSVNHYRSGFKIKQRVVQQSLSQQSENVPQHEPENGTG